MRTMKEVFLMFNRVPLNLLFKSHEQNLVERVLEARSGSKDES